MPFFGNSPLPRHVSDRGKLTMAASGFREALADSRPGLGPSASPANLPHSVPFPPQPADTQISTTFSFPASADLSFAQVWLVSKLALNNGSKCRVGRGLVLFSQPCIGPSDQPGTQQALRTRLLQVQSQAVLFALWFLVPLPHFQAEKR